MSGNNWSLSARGGSLFTDFLGVDTLPRIVVVARHHVSGDVVEVSSSEFLHVSEAWFLGLVSSVCHFYYLKYSLT